MWEFIMEPTETTETTDNLPSVPPSPPAKKGSFLRNLSYLLLGATILALSGVIIYLLSDINHRQYRLNAQGSVLLVERGKFLPVGFEAYVPKDATLQPIYAPIPLPKGVTMGPSEIFADRTDVDRAIFGLLSGWSRERIDSNTDGDFELVVGYINRCETLPGLAEEQRNELQTLRADVAYKTGLRTLKGIADQLNKALEQFELALTLGTTHADDAEAWITEIKHRIEAYQSSTSPAVEGNPQNAVTPSVEPPNSPVEVTPPTTPAPSEAPGAPTPQSAPQPPGSTQQKWRL